MQYPIGKSIFAVNLLLKLSPATVANADIGSLKSLHTLLDRYLDHMLVKFKRNCMVQTTRDFDFFFFTKNVWFFFFLTIFDKTLTVAETIV